MNDLTICKKIAEIKGLMPNVVSGSVITTRGLLNFFDLSSTHMANKTTRYLFDLMFEFGVCVHHESFDVWICGGDNFDGCLSVKSFKDGCELSFRRAILLAIIEAHKD